MQRGARRHLAWLPAFAAAAVGQSPVPDAHWGACIHPESRPELRLSLSLNRFTEFSKTGRPGDPTSQYYNEIRETMGFNIVTLGWTDEFVTGAGQRFTHTIHLGIGPTDDQPTSFLQNEYIHKALGQLQVPVGETRDATEFVGAGSLYAWFGDNEPHEGHEKQAHHPIRLQGYVGLGACASTLYSEANLALGGSVLFTSLLDRAYIEVTASDRPSWPYAAEAIPDVAHFTNTAQVGIAYVPADFFATPTGTFGEGFDLVWRTESLLPWRWPGLIYDFIGRPKIGVHLTYDTGLFVDAADDPIDTWFAGLRFDWATGLRIETYNDFANGSDWGPTYGLIVSWDLRTTAGSLLR